MAAPHCCPKPLEQGKPSPKRALQGWGPAGGRRTRTPRPPAGMGTERRCQLWGVPSSDSGEGNEPSQTGSGQAEPHRQNAGGIKSSLWGPWRAPALLSPPHTPSPPSGGTQGAPPSSSKYLGQAGVCQTAGLGREGPGSPWAVPVPVTEGAEGVRDGFSGALDCWGDQRQACLFRILIAVVSCWRSRCLDHPSHPIPAVPSLPRRAPGVTPGVTAPSTTELTEKGE